MNRMRLLILAALLAALCLVAACGGPVPPETDAAAGDGDPGSAAVGETWPDAAACDLLPGEPARGGEVVLALGDEVLPARAPVPTNESERTVFANLYETLTTVDCAGEVAGGLAVSWQRLDEGRRWRLQLRPDAVFWDGSAVTANDVVAAWYRNEALANAGGRPCPGLWIAAGSRGLAVLGPSLLEIRLAEPQDDLPRLLAHPALAVAVRREGWSWPVGSGPCRLAADTERPLPDLVCRPNLHHPRAPAWQQFVFRIRPEVDPRDLLTVDVDLAVIRDRSATDYYAGLTGVHAAPLPWNRLYLLVVAPSSGLDGATAAAALRRSITVAESRPWTRLDFHGCGHAPCPQLHGPTVGVLAPPVDPDPAALALAARHLRFPAGDRDARALAERAVAFLAADLELRPTRDADLARTLQQGDGGAFVVPLTASYPTACLTTAALVARADWLQRLAGDRADACDVARDLQATGHVLPLVQTRPRLLWRKPLAGLRLGHDGALLVDGLGPASDEATP